MNNVKFWHKEEGVIGTFKCVQRNFGPIVVKGVIHRREPAHRLTVRLAKAGWIREGGAA